MDFRPKVACITNVDQNHLDWHVDFNEYFDSKKQIYMNQKNADFLILNFDDEKLKDLKPSAFPKGYFFSRHTKVNGAYCQGDLLLLEIDGHKIPICDRKDIKLKGEHNISNVLCSCLCAHLLGATPEGMQKVLLEFHGLPHRFEMVADIDGVEFIDDSKATTVDATRAALSSCASEVVLIAGGRDKGSDFTKIKEAISSKVKALVLIGEATDKIKKSLKDCVQTYDASDMDEAVSISFDKASSSDIVLLSPMCASFDMYKSYKDRGEAFKCAVLKLKKSKKVSA